MEIAIVGAGKIGLPLALLIAESNDSHIVTIYDINPTLNKSSEPGVNELIEKVGHRIGIAKSVDDIKYYKLIYVCLPTPSLEDNTYDTTLIEEFIAKLDPKQRNEIVIISTVNPGFAHKINPNSRRFNYVYSPVFVAQGSIIQNLKYPEQILVGFESNKTQYYLNYLQVQKGVFKNKPKLHFMNYKSAEITKLAVNCFLTTKISYANMIGDIAKKSGLNPDQILEAVGSDTRIGNKFLKYGDSYGGPCLPRDNKALYTYADSVGVDAKVSKATEEYNNYHLELLIEEYMQKPEPVVFNRFSYKEGVELYENSCQLKIAKALVERGKRVELCSVKEISDVFNFGN